MTIIFRIMYWLSMKNLRAGSAVTRPSTATAFLLRLRLHYKAACVGSVRAHKAKTIERKS